MEQQSNRTKYLQLVLYVIQELPVHCKIVDLARDNLGQAVTQPGAAAVASWRWLSMVDTITFISKLFLVQMVFQVATTTHVFNTISSFKHVVVSALQTG